DRMQFAARGWYTNNDGVNAIPLVNSNQVRRHPQYSAGGTLDNDVGIFRLNPSNAVWTGMPTEAERIDLHRASGAANGDLLSNAVGVGNSNAVGGWGGGTGDKRRFNANI